MNILGIGPLELTLILLIALIVIGPNDLIKTGRTLGRWMRKIITSPEWKAVQTASRELRTLPNRLIREAGIDEAQQTIREQMNGFTRINHGIQSDIHHIQTDLSSWVTPAHTTVPSQKDLTEYKSLHNSSTPMDTPAERQ